MTNNSLQPVTLLIIDDSESDRVAYSRYLQSELEQEYQIIEAETLEEGLKLWRSQQPDVVLIDLNLPDGNGLEFLEVINSDRASKKVPVIMLAGQGNEKMAVSAMKLGAADYFVKGDITAKLLTTTINRVIRESLLNQQLAIAYQQLQDELTDRKRVEKLFLEQQLEIENRNKLLERTTEKLQCTVEELRVTTEDLISQHRQLEYEQSRYENLFNFSPDGYLVTDITGRILEANKTVLDLLAISHGDILGQLFTTFIDFYHLELFHKQLHFILSQNKLDSTWEINITPHQGKTFSAEIIATKNVIAETNNIQILWVVRNISDRKRAERELQQLNQFLEAKVRDRTQELWQVNQLQSAILNGTNYAIISTDLNGIIQTFNAGAETMLGYSMEEVVGKVTPEIFCDSQEMSEKITKASTILGRDLDLGFESLMLMAMAGLIDEEWINIRKDGSRFPVSISVTVLKDDQDQPIGVLTVRQDISDRKQSELQLQTANQELLRATKLKDEFLANMSHELRTPLNSILGLSESLKEEILGSLNEKQLRAISTIESSGEHLLSLINDILDISKISAGMITLDITSVSIKSICSSSLLLVKQLAFTKGIQIYSNIPSQINNININVDDRRIKQVLINLLTNAVKFTANEGRVSLSVAIGKGNTWQGEATIPQQLKDINTPQVIFQVADTGIGIAAKDLPILFRPFMQIDSALNRQYEGTGLGLALVKQIVELHGGQVLVESEVGKGSCFTVALPYEISAFNTIIKAIASVPDSPTAPLLETPPDKAPLILLAEDNEANIQTFNSYLTAIKYRVIISRNGLEAVAQAKANLPDIILMDIQMPTMDGLEAIKQIRLDPSLINIPIIALTALVMEGDRERCLAAGANEYLSKPVKLRELNITIQKFLAKN
jgi:PAS domain S-box-containing protein